MCVIGKSEITLRMGSVLVGIELLFNFTKSRVFTVLPTAIQINWSQMELSFASSPVTLALRRTRLNFHSLKTKQAGTSDGHEARIFSGWRMRTVPRFFWRAPLRSQFFRSRLAVKRLMSASDARSSFFTLISSPSESERPVRQAS